MSIPRATCLAVVAVAAAAGRARADERPTPTLFASWDLQPSHDLAIRGGAATLDGVTQPTKGYAVLLGAVRVRYAYRDLELGFGAHVAVFSGEGDSAPTVDLGLGLPSLRAGYAHRFGRLRVGGYAQTSLGAVERTGTQSPADLAAGVFLLDDALTWSRAWHILAVGQVQWSDGLWTVQGGAGTDVYFGGPLRNREILVRANAGVAREVLPYWVASAEVLVLSDLLEEGSAEPYEVVPVGTLALQHSSPCWSHGGAISYGWVDAAPGVGRPGFVFMFEASRAL